VTPPANPAGGARFTLIWQPAAIAGLIRLRAADPVAAKDVRAAAVRSGTGAKVSAPPRVWARPLTPTRSR
jgi:hypothetical protein